MKKIIIAALLTLNGFIYLVACNKDNDPANPVATDSTLTAFEKESLAFMREEEKLAYDVYTMMYSQWGLIQFNNISRSESNHMNAVKTLLDRYGLADPAGGNAAGVFTNSRLQELFNQLIEEGNRSSTSSLMAGAAIEEIDIRDLKEQLQQTRHSAIILVYENLMRGSRNHLRAFVGTLKAAGVNYTPQYLTQQEFDAIINSDMETGGRRSQ
ncbi:MAG: DUF2202 domain-containing protein [Terrimonas sp.]|nr:DUF2202 domain-containing protein [Terrimonas sp.]